jgi:hypothetical protein
MKNALAYDNGVVFVNSTVVGLAPELIFFSPTYFQLHFVNQHVIYPYLIKTTQP